MKRLAAWRSNLTPERKRVVVVVEIAAASIVLSLILLGQQKNFVTLYSKKPGRIERIEKLSGSVNRVSVVVLVKGDLTAAEQASLRQAVTLAVGLDMNCGDTVAVVPVRAEKTTVPQLERRGAQKAPKFFWYWLAAVPVLLPVATPPPRGMAL